MGKYAKAITGGLVAFGAGFTTSVADSSAGGSTVTANEWVMLAVATVVATLAIWAVPNSPQQ